MKKWPQRKADRRFRLMLEMSSSFRATPNNVDYPQLERSPFRERKKVLYRNSGRSWLIVARIQISVWSSTRIVVVLHFDAVAGYTLYVTVRKSSSNYYYFDVSFPDAACGLL